MSNATKEKPKAKADPQIAKLSEQVSELTDKFNATMDLLAQTAQGQQALVNALSRPVVKTGIVDAGEFDLPPVRDVELTTTGDAELIKPEIEVPDGPISKDHLAELAFNEEYVEVLVHDTNDAMAEPIVEIRNNGTLQMFPRGMVVKCRRKYLEGLVRSKPVIYGNVEYVREDGSRAVKYPQKTSLRYGFQVVRDDNPRGRKWLATIMAQQA